MPLDIKVTQFPGGVGTAGDANLLNAVPNPLPALQSLVVEDFTGGSNYDDAWSTVNIVGGVASALPLLSASGILQLTTTGTPGDGASLEADGGTQLVDGHLVSAGVPSWFAARLAFSDPVAEGWLMGFVPAGSALAPADGLYLLSAAASGDVNLIIENNGAAQESVLVGTLTAADTDQFNIGLYWDGEKMAAQFGPGGGASLIPAVANIPAVGLNPTFAVVEGAGGAATVDLDSLAFGGGRT